MSIHTLLVDDHLLVMLGIQRLLESEEDIEVINTVHDPSILIKTVEDTRPDVIVTDIRMKQYNGIELTKDLLSKFPDVKVVILSGYDHEEYYNAAFEAGASAYITKERSAFDLANAIRQSHMGYILFSKNQIIGNNIEALTSAEQRILLLISKDKTNYEISTDLSISKRTVEYHISSIIRKLGVDSRVGAVVKGIKKGLIEGF
ncbi:DNA-binding response regulator [Bacillus cereus]|uniref:Response regulator transcription factor n=2 Tax=Bacillus proteolyticus TaxID=2026192 RepID=A0ABV3I989_9BACI|nr:MULTISPECIES: response regulator transcription factor [Bacillus cereus group]PEB83767.1 DNA-binding response regulator [Bacillus cereus]MBJ8105817.1 response regulator transcription factor [Bacillus cereus group sp. N8]PEW85899.1 DNA-binding response regulator [Bacillus cereus]PFH79320.1 DNA-binding response regulator [Bacillus cereus]PFN64548.1 DNA-binding response regulator [Bacillus cereus]